MSKVQSFLVSVLGLVAMGPLLADAARDPDQILKEVQAKLEMPQEMARLKMVVTEPDGQSKNRDVEIRRMNEDKFAAVLVKLQAPPDVRGVAFLSKYTSGKEEQWLYSPTLRRARRVVSGNKQQRFLDTEFSLDDFSADTYGKFTNKVVKDEPGSLVVESLAKSKDSSYSKIITWIRSDEMRVDKAEYYDQSGKLLKTMAFSDYQKYGDAVRAKTIEVKNVQTNRSTVLKLAALKPSKGLKKNHFSPKALEDE